MDKMTDSRAADAQAQGGGEACQHCKGNPGLDCNSFGRTAPPSAPVGAEDIEVLRRIRAALPDVGVNGWIVGVRTLDRVLAALEAAREDAEDAVDAERGRARCQEIGHAD